VASPHLDANIHFNFVVVMAASLRFGYIADAKSITEELKELRSLGSVSRKARRGIPHEHEDLSFHSHEVDRDFFE
jgi:hypothetical protein